MNLQPHDGMLLVTSRDAIARTCPALASPRRPTALSPLIRSTRDPERNDPPFAKSPGAAPARGRFVIAAGMQRSGTQVVLQHARGHRRRGHRQRHEAVARQSMASMISSSGTIRRPSRLGCRIGGFADSRRFSPTVIRWSSKPIGRRRPRYGSASPTAAPLRRTCSAIRVTSLSRRWTRARRCARRERFRSEALRG